MSGEFSCFARYANDRLCETDDNARAEWVNGKIKIISKEDIAAGDEITYSYWKDFWIKNRDSLSKSARQKMIFYHNVKEHEMIYRTHFDSQGRNKDLKNSNMITNPTMQIMEKISLLADRIPIAAVEVKNYSIREKHKGWGLKGKTVINSGVRIYTSMLNAGYNKVGETNNRTEMMKIELVNTQSNRLIRMAACSAAHKSKGESHKDRAGVMKIELPYTQNDRLVMTAVCSATGIGGCNRSRVVMVKMSWLTPRAID